MRMALPTDRVAWGATLTLRHCGLLLPMQPAASRKLAKSLVMEPSDGRASEHEGSRGTGANQKHILLLADNELWRSIEGIEKAFRERIDNVPEKTGSNRKQERNLSTKEEVLGISTETLRKMVNGSLAKGNRVTNTVASNLLALAERAEYKLEFLAVKHPQRSTGEARQLVGRLKEIATDIQNDNINQSRGNGVSNYEFGRILGMDRAGVQKAIAASIHNAKPLLKIYYVEQESELEQLRGIYHLWMQRLHFEADSKTHCQLWMRCGLQVRHILDVHSQSIIVAKLNIPALKNDRVQEASGSSEQGHHQYDGVVTIRNGRCFWSFEKRVQIQEDLIHIITEPTSGIGLAFAGYYLTVDQDLGQTITTGAALIRVPQSKSETVDVVAFMKTAPQVYVRGSPEFDEVNELSRAAHKTHHELSD